MNQQAKKDQNEKPAFLFRRHDNGSLTPGRLVPGDTQLELAPKVYEPRMFDEGPMMQRLGLFEIEAVKPPTKIYGDIHRHVTRYFRRYEAYNENVGVRLIGTKGSGKTTTLRCATATALQLGMPVIMVNTKLPGDILVMLMESIQQNCLVAFEEFDKTYGAVEVNAALRTAEFTDQNEMLRILDGSVGGGKKLFFLLGNDPGRFTAYLDNRPSRIRYTRMFGQLPLDIMMPYVRDNLKDCTDLQLLHFKKFRELSAELLNFDMMAAIVDEMNMFHIPLSEAVDDMFSNITLRGATSYLVEMTLPDGTVEDTEGVELLVPDEKGWVIRVLGKSDRSPHRYSLADADFKGFKDLGPQWVTLYEKDGVRFALYAERSERTTGEKGPTSLFEFSRTEVQERLKVVRGKRWEEDAREREEERVREEEKKKTQAAEAAAAGDPPRPEGNWSATTSSGSGSHANRVLTSLYATQPDDSDIRPATAEDPRPKWAEGADVGNWTPLPPPAPEHN